MIEQVIDRVVTEAATRSVELIAARQEWDELTGKVYDDDPLYEERTAGFLEWYAIERHAADGRRPIDRLLASLPVSDPDREGMGLLRHSHRSVFVVRRAREPHVELDDLLGGCAFRVYERRQPIGLSEGDVFEARLCARVDHSGDVVMTRALQHHPREAREAIEAIAAEGGPRDAIMFRLAKLRWKAARWGHVTPERIYRGEHAE